MKTNAFLSVLVTVLASFFTVGGMAAEPVGYVAPKADDTAQQTTVEVRWEMALDELEACAHNPDCSEVERLLIEQRAQEVSCAAYRELNLRHHTLGQGPMLFGGFIIDKARTIVAQQREKARVACLTFRPAQGKYQL